MLTVLTQIFLLRNKRNKRNEKKKEKESFIVGHLVLSTIHKMIKWFSVNAQSLKIRTENFMKCP